MLIALQGLACVHVADAQPFYFKHYQTEHGLSNNIVLCALQDRRGFMWFGTKDGLNRFDGYSFKVFKNKPADSNSLYTNSIRSLHEDAQGALWVGTERGIFLYNEKMENFSFVKGGATSEIRSMLVDNKNQLWYVADFSIYKYDIAKGTTISYRTLAGVSNVTSLYFDKRGNIWGGTLFGKLLQYNPAKDNFSSYDIFSHSPPATSHEIQCMYDMGDGEIFIGTIAQGVKKFNTLKKTYTDVLTYNEDHTEIFARDFVQYSKDELWVATESGIYTYNLRTNNINNFHKEYYNPYSLSDNAIYTLCKDREGGIWAGTYFGGINYLPKQNFVIQKYFPTSGKNSISGNAVREMVADHKGNLWIGTEDAGLNKLNATTGQYQHFLPDNDAGAISHFNIHGLLVHNEQLWIGTFEHGLNVMDLNTLKIIKHYQAGPGANDLKSNFIHNFCKTKNGIILICSSNGLYRYNEPEDNFTLIEQLPFNTFYSAITEDHTGTIWVGTFTSGVFFINFDKKIHGHIQIDINGKNQLQQNRILYLKEDADRRLWIATEAGAYAVSADRKKTTHYTSSTALPGNLVYTIMQDSLKNIWFSTSKGLARMDNKTGRIHTFSKADGLLAEQFNYNSAFEDKQGNFYFGTVKGYIRFNPYTFTVSNFKPPIYITGLQLFNKDVAINGSSSPLHQSISFTNAITLRYNQSTFSIDFAALSYTAPESIEYAYQLEGLDKEWSYIKTNRRIYFTDLSPGDYMLKVRSTNASGVWADNQKNLYITILPPWWRSSWAYGLYIVLLLAITYFIARFFHDRQMMKQKRKMELFELNKEKELYQLKIDFFTKVAHEIRTPLTLIKAPMERMLQQISSLPHLEKYLLIMNKNTQRLLTLTNELLDFRKAEASGGPQHFKKMNIVSITQNIFQNFISIAEAKNISFQFEKKKEAILGDINEESFTKIISNMLDNAIKYAAGIVVLCIDSRDKENIEIKVSNDGKLIPAALHEKIFEPFYRSKDVLGTTGSGIGLSLSRSLAQLHNGTLTVHIEDNRFNTFTFRFPSKNRH